MAILSAAMSSVSSALTSLASVSTMDFVKHVLHRKNEEFFLRFSKVSTVLWALALILVGLPLWIAILTFDGFLPLRDRGPRELFDATCARCGKDTQVPFRPTGARPVYCSDCFRLMRG